MHLIIKSSSGSDGKVATRLELGEAENPRRSRALEAIGIRAQRDTTSPR
jgi:hypothetical protein